MVLKKTKGGRPFGKQNDLATTFLLISERSLEGKCTQNSILLYLGVEDQPGLAALQPGLLSRPAAPLLAVEQRDPGQASEAGEPDQYR